MSESPRIGACLIAINHRGGTSRILLGRRAKPPHVGKWVIPGGGIRLFETMRDAALREFKEETGLTAVLDGAHFTAYEIVDSGAGEHRICLYALAELKSEKCHAGGDITELKFVDIRELHKVELTPLCRQVLRDFGFIQEQP